MLDGSWLMAKGGRSGPGARGSAGARIGFPDSGQKLRDLAFPDSQFLMRKILL